MHTQIRMPEHSTAQHSTAQRALICVQENRIESALINTKAAYTCGR